MDDILYANQQIYKRIAEACEKRGVKITNLDLALGFSRGWTGKLRQYKRLAPYNRLQLIAAYLDVDPEWLFAGEETPKSSDSGKTYYFSDEAATIAQEIQENADLRALFDAAQDVSAEDLRKFAAMLKVFKDGDKP